MSAVPDVVGFHTVLISTLLVATLFSNCVVFNMPTNVADVGDPIPEEFSEL